MTISQHLNLQNSCKTRTLLLQKRIQLVDNIKRGFFASENMIVKALTRIAGETIFSELRVKVPHVLGWSIECR